MKKMLYTIIIAFFFIIGILSIFLIKSFKPDVQSLGGKQMTHSAKPVVLLIIDSLMDKPLQKAIEEGRAPAFQFLIDNGYYDSNMISSYPTMSVTIDSTLLTGTYSDKHRVPALVWYNEKEKRLVSYGSAKEEILKLGVKNILEDSIVNLNAHHLSRDVNTIHEAAASKGLQSASINALLYRGTEKKTLRLPTIMAKLNVAPKKLQVETPTLFSYGALAQFNPKNNKNNNIWDGFGFNDKFSAQELKYFIQHETVPAFTIAYFSDLDKMVHKKGPVNHLKGIEDADKQLQEIFNSFDSWEEAVKEVVWIVMGDSGQAEIGKDKKESLIDLKSKLGMYKIHKITESVKQEDQLVLAVNERMAFIYSLDEQVTLEDIVNKFKDDHRLNFIAWKSGSNVNVVANGKKMNFHLGGDFKDEYHQSWSLEGDLSALDLTLKNKQIFFGKYPDALARLHSSLHSHSGNYIIVDAKPGFEFVGEGTPVHLGGGSHGSIHEKDSIVPLIVAGTDKRPAHSRIVDLYPWILQLMHQ
nr:alkaline phosphatase family protein [Pueribacillus theae]